jgi:hypothetical protein
MNAMNPPISGQYTPVNIYEPARTRLRPGTRRPWVGTARLGVQRNLLVGRGERPRDLHAALLAKDEPELARGPEPVGMVGSEGRAGPGLRDRAEQVLVKEAVFAAGFCDPGPCLCHSSDLVPVMFRTKRLIAIKADFAPLVQR